MLNSIPCPSRRTILLSLLGLILLIITLQWLSRENLYEFLHEGDEAALIHHIGHIRLQPGKSIDRISYEDIPKDSPLYQEVMEILRSIRPILLAYEDFKHAESIYFRFILCEKQGGVITGASTLDS